MKAFYNKVLTLKLFFVLVSVLLYTACGNVEPEWEAEQITEASTEYIRDVTVDLSGDIVIAADSYDESGQDIVVRCMVVKYNEAGTLMWSYVDPSPNSRITGLQIGTDNSIFVSGSGSGGAYVIKLTEGGTLDWSQRALGGSWFTGGLAVGSTTVYMTNISTYAFDVETGEALWQVDGEQRTTDLILDSSENVYIAGYNHRAKYSSDGAELWNIMWDNDFSIISLAIDADDDVFAVGGKTGTSNIHVMKMDNAGGFIVESAVQTVNSYWSPRIGIDPEGHVIIAVSGEDRDLGRRVIKYSNELSVIWSKKFESGAQSSDLDDMIVDSSGDIYLTGGDITTKVDSNGSHVLTVSSGTKYSENFFALDMNEEYLYIATQKEAYGEKNILLLKYRAY